MRRKGKSWDVDPVYYFVACVAGAGSWSGEERECEARECVTQLKERTHYVISFASVD